MAPRKKKTSIEPKERHKKYQRINGPSISIQTEYTDKSEEVDKMRLALIEPRRELEEHNEEISRCTLEMAKHSKKFSHYFEQRLAAATAARARIFTMILQEQRTESRNELWKAMDNLNRKNIAKLKNMADYVALKEFLSGVETRLNFRLLHLRAALKPAASEKELELQISKVGTYTRLTIKEILQDLTDEAVFNLRYRVNRMVFAHPDDDDLVHFV